MIQRLLPTFFSFTITQNKPNTTIESLPWWNDCMWVLHCCITSLFMFVRQWHYFILECFVKFALDFCKVRIKLPSTHSKASRTCFLISSHCHDQPLHCLILTFRSNYDAYCHSFSTRNIDLHIDSIRIFGCCPSCLVILVVPVALCILCVRSRECKHIMSCIGVG